MVLCVPPVKECYLSKIISYVHFPASCSDALYVFGITFRFLDSVLPISMNGKRKILKVKGHTLQTANL